MTKPKEKTPPVVDTDKAPPVVETPPDAKPADAAPETLTPPQKRGRGRPPKDPNETAKTPGGAAPRSHKKKDGAKVTYGRDAEQKLAQQIVGLHQIGALMSGIPEMQISPAEGEMLATGVIAVAVEYDLELSGKTGAAIQLLMACVAVYVPRLLAVKNRVAQQQLLNAQSPNVNDTAAIN